LLVIGFSINNLSSNFKIENKDVLVESPLENLMASLLACEILTLRYHAEANNFLVKNIQVVKSEASYDKRRF
jgi:uncharacterized OsmC-like protein